MARIRRFSSRVEAEMAASMLVANGIDAYVMNDDSGGMHPNLAFGLGTSEVIVPDEQLDDATVLLDAADVDGGRQVGPDEATHGAGRSWLRLGALLIVAGIVLVVLSSELDLRWF
ncbi:MAG: putative signal transducing protein [Nitriliruptoraceae bacterium]